MQTRVPEIGNGASYLASFRDAYRESPVYWGEAPSSLLIGIPSVESSTDERLALDLGCGQGRNTKLLLAKGYRVLAIDVLLEAVAEVRRTCRGRVSAICADALEFLATVPEGSVDVILANHLFQHFRGDDDLGRFRSGAGRALRVGGYLAVAFFVEPRSLHPPLVREQAFLATPGSFARELQAAAPFDLLQDEVLLKNDRHGPEIHCHRIERVLACRGSGTSTGPTATESA